MIPTIRHLFPAVAAALLAAAPAHAFELRSADLPAAALIAQAQIANGFGCTGGNLSPALSWSDPPVGTRSFAVTAYDPDAPTGSGWWHWVLFNLPASTTGLPAGAGRPDGASLPAGAVQSRTDIGTPGYFGPCPPPGDAAHRYVFTIHALKVDRLDLPPDSSGALVGFFLTANRLGQATLTARYGR